MAIRETKKRPSVVSLVGAGPGDPGLLTLRALEKLKQADVVIYDHLIPPFILEYAPTEAERIYVGKWGTEKRAMPQAAINELMAVCARSGRRVVRMKGGDPFVFGRGGEEASYLAENGIPFEIVPGVTSAIAAPAYAGIPVTDRRLSSSFTVVTGHEDPDRSEARVDWHQMANTVDTLVILMGSKRVEQICSSLIDAGRSPDTPVAVISSGTYARQTTVQATLSTLPNIVGQKPIVAPSLCIVGDVVRLRQTLNWLENRPLAGLRVLVPQNREQAMRVAEKLMYLGAEPVVFPVTKLVESGNLDDVKLTISRISIYDWIVFSSSNAVEWFFARLFDCGKDARALGGGRVAAVGSATAARLRGFGIIPDVVPEEFHADGMVDALLSVSDATPVAEWRVLFPRALVGRDILPDRLRKRGAEVDVLPVYRTVVNVEADGRALDAALVAGQIDVGLFTSPSTFDSLIEVLGGVDLARPTIKKMKTVAIGATTEASIRRFGLEAPIMPKESTIDGMLDALSAWATEHREAGRLP